MAELDIGAVRAFVAVAECGHFGDAADRLGITQQAVSKRVARLEADLGVSLRSRTGLSPQGEAFLPYARTLLDAADRARAALRQQPLKVDVLDTRLVGSVLMRRFHEAARIDVEVVASPGPLTTLTAGTVDAAFARVAGRRLAEGVTSVPAWLEPAVVLVADEHPLAASDHVTMADLAGATAWMPGNLRGSEWADFWDATGAEFGIRIDTTGPHFGWEHFVAELGTRHDRIGFVGEQCLVPDHPHLTRLTLRGPRPAYPWSLLWQRHNRHTALPRLVDHVRHGFRPPADLWVPPADRAFTRS